jgi:predicted PurR-regulated permease PerM
MSEAGRAEKPSLRLLYGLAAGTLLVAGLRFAAPVLVPIALALFLAILSAPLFQGLLARHVPPALAIALTLAVLCAAIALFGLLLLGTLGEVREAGPHYAAALKERIAYTVDWWQQKGIAVVDWIPARFRGAESLAELAGGTLAGVARLLSETTIVLLTLCFLLHEAVVMPRKLERLPPAVRGTIRHLATVSRELQRYLAIKTLMSVVIGLTAGLWVAYLGVDFAVLCGMLAFAFHFVPNVGAVLAAAPAMLVAFVQYDPSKALAIGAGYLVIGLGLGNLLEPALLGRRLNLSPLAVFLSLVVWGWIWGPIGMFLSVPLTMALKILFDHSADWSWVARLLDGGVRADGEAEGGALGAEDGVPTRPA